MTAAGPAGHAPARAVTPAEFRLFQELIHREAGIYLSEAKKALLVGRLSRRLRELGLTTFEEYHRVAVQDPAEKVRMLDCVATNETHFFREPRQFEFLAGEIVPRWTAAAAEGTRARRVRVWSAACSTGEEPYSIAMLLLDLLPPSAGWQVDILASDISTRVLGRAREATWPLERAQEIPERYLKRYMLRGTGEHAGLMKAGPELRDCVRFERLNLNGDAYPSGRFDLVFCRNVLIYFDATTKAGVLRRLAQRLEPGGHLFLGHAESVIGMTETLRRAGPTIYAAGGAA